jgi:hypothetical protein
MSTVTTERSTISVVINTVLIVGDLAFLSFVRVFRVSISSEEYVVFSIRIQGSRNAVI